ncbi:cadherin-like beta sandwich domain-containing protein [Terrimonas sp. NA20]|uniref:Cadherin-like beta sandwich domain-containing protein n=1 Tax=Terrimonas ginsenosidimutans TaxID=2908004 RepID=A0ABS9KW53_9BACT|nr:cadherin-like beta sandwich domain-containing protein [Terrimonas ginsenosidimutans]MCG2616550.1 cadherin-like beta sandwich domain-containing protein [Terrimonas ginsenosidimutans]
MRTESALQAYRLPRLLCNLLTGVILFSTSHTAFAQLAAYRSVFAGTGVSGYYAGDNNDAATAQFSQPKAAAFDASGNLLITDIGNNVIRKISPDRKVSVIAGIPRTVGSMTPWPSGVATNVAIPTAGAHITVAGNGAIYFMSNGFMVGTIFNGNISYFTPEHMNAGAGYSLSRHNCMKARGNFLYMGHQGTISVIDLTTRKQVRTISVTPGIETMSLALDANGNIFCLNAYGQLSRIDGTTFAQTTIKAQNSDSELWTTTGADMAIDGQGNLYLATDFSYIITYTAGTYVKGKIQGDGKYAGVAIDANGTVYMPDRSLNKITRVQYLDENTRLSGLGISAGTLFPSFSIYSTNYTVSVPNNVDKINITPTIEASTTTAQVRVNGGAYTALASGATSADMNLNVGSNTINILLQPQHPTNTRTMTITVTRLGVPPSTPDNFVVTPATNSVRLSWDAAPGATRYNVYRSTSPTGFFSLLTGTPITTLTYSNTIAVGTPFYYYVVALESTGAESPRTAVTEGRANTPPVVTGLATSGNAWEGATLSADYTYTDVDGGTNSSTYLWYRYPQATGTTGRIIIPGATARTYTLAAADVGKYVSVRIVPNDGITTSTAIESARVLVSAGTLPVKLVSFQSKVVNKAVQLDWKTATEINSHYFAIERSNDTRSWETIGRVNAAGDSYTPLSYSFTDRTPLNGHSFYRLKTVDRDATFETSATLQVDLSASVSAISVYPIPAINTITVKGGDRTREQAFSITDAEGKIVRRGLLTQSVQDIDIQELKKGIYFLKIEQQNAVRFIKQ